MQYLPTGMRMPKWSHHFLFGAVALVLTVGLGNDSPPALIDHAQKMESGLLEFEKQVVKNPSLLGMNGMHVLVNAKKLLVPFKQELELEAKRVAAITDASYEDESRTIIEASLRYINLMARTYYLYAKSAHYSKNDSAKMSFSKLNDAGTVLLDIRLPRRIGLAINSVGTYLTPRHDEQDPYYWWISLPLSDRMLAEMFALSRNEEGDMTLTSDYESEDQYQSQLIERYRNTTFRIHSEQEYARLLQFVALRESLFNRWVINRLRSKKIPETAVNSCGSGEFLSFRTSSSAPELSSEMPAYTGWAEMEERINDLSYAADRITPAIQKLSLATNEQNANIIVTAMRAQPGFDLMKEKIKMTYSTNDAGIETAVKIKKKDSKGLTLGERVSNYIYNYWVTEGRKIVLMSNHPSDPFNPAKMAERVGIFTYEAFRDAATSMIAADLLNTGWVKYENGNEASHDAAYYSIVNVASREYDRLFKQSFQSQVAALVLPLFKEIQDPAIKAHINGKVLEDKIATVTESANTVLPWVKEYRDLRIQALSNGYIKEYDSSSNPQPSPYEHLLLTSKSNVPRVAKIDSFGAALSSITAKLNLEPNQTIAEWLSLDPSFAALYVNWMTDAAVAFEQILKNQTSSTLQADAISLALQSATEKMREAAKPTYMMKLGHWVDENVSTTVISEKDKQAIVDWLKKPAVASAPLKTETLLPKPKSKNPSDKTFKAEIRRDQIQTGPVPGPKLTEKVERLIDALGFAAGFPKNDQELLKTDFERMRYAMYRMSEVVAVEPMLGIPLYDSRITEVMDEPNTYKGDGMFAGLQTGPSAGTKTRSGRVKHAGDKTGMIPQYSRLVELMGDASAKPKELIQAAIQSAAVQGKGIFETFCQANASQWDSDANFKKIFMSTVTLRKSMMDIDPKLAELDLSMQKELRSPMEKIQEDYLQPIMNALFYITIAFLVCTFPLSPVSAVVTSLIRAYVPSVLMTLASAAMFWGFNGAMVGNMVTRTYVNFYEKPLEVKFAQAVAAQNLGDSDKTLTSWSETVKQQAQLKSDQSAAVRANVVDGVFAGMFLSQLHVNFGFKAEQAARELGLKPLSAAERQAESMTSREHAKLLQESESGALNKPTRLEKLSSEVDRQVEQFARKLPKYQKFTSSEIAKAYRDSLKNSMRGKNLDTFKPELDASIEFLNKRLASSKLKFEELMQRPDLNTFWLAPRSLSRGVKNWGQEWYELEQDVNLLRRSYISQKIKLATSIEEKRIASLEMGEEAGPYWIDILSDEELALLPDLAEGPGYWWNRWAVYEGGPLNHAVMPHYKNYQRVVQGFSPVVYQPIKSWWGDNIDQLRYTENGKQLYALEKSVAKQNRAADPMRDIDYLQIQAIESTYADLTARGIISHDTGQVIRPLASLSESDRRLLERYLRGENFKLAMTEAKLDYKNPQHVSEYQDIVEYYSQMQALDGMKVLEDKQYQELQKRLDRKLGVLDHSLEEMVKEHNLR